MSETAVKENKMGTMPVKKLIVSMSLPMMISMLVQALYNIVDSIFVAQLSQDAMNAVTLVFPMQNLMIALGMGTGVGINAILSKSLGEKKQEEADNAANTGILLNFCHFLLFVLVGLFISKRFIYSQTDIDAVADYGISYLKVISVLSFGCFFQVTFERLLQSTGRTNLSMISQLTGAIINTILDPIMIFGLFGFPRMEVAGAALATCIGQMCAACVGLFLNIRYNKEIHLSFNKIIHPNSNTV
ncbi:MAG: polysaccharide biosynthesis C-terminal domain-containing protein, partial [Clostridiales bacterium]|nr:polysaccharide biosynthesis C-terminal domain-containing protein [Clostridiales bacterium]